MRRSTLAQGCSVRWRTNWPFSCSVPRGTYVGRREQPGALKTRHSALAHRGPRSCVFSPLRIVHEQYRELGTSGGSDEPSWSRSQ
jgi:hypothetical protein